MEPHISVFGLIRIKWMNPLVLFALRISVRKLSLTPRNLNLDGQDSKNKCPELGSAFKGVHVKMILWYLTGKAIQFAEQSDVAWYVKRNEVITDYSLSSIILGSFYRLYTSLFVEVH